MKTMKENSATYENHTVGNFSCNESTVKVSAYSPSHKPIKSWNRDCQALGTDAINLHQQLRLQLLFPPLKKESI